MPSHALWLGIDTGGTFTDVVWAGPGGQGSWKLPSTPEDPALAVLAAIRHVAGPDLSGQDLRIQHGTTVGTNAVLTLRGARVAFITTANFEDLLAIGRGHRDDLHALMPTRLEPLAPRERCFGIEERIDVQGDVVHAPSAEAVARLVQRVRRARVDAVAICLLHSLRSDRHERALARALGAVVPYVFCSAENAADPGEVERAETTVLHAYVAPLVTAYVDRLADALPAKTLTVLRSDGGRMSRAAVADAPARTLLSGPAAGVGAARALARRHGLARILSFDVGGTSTDVAWVEQGALPLGGALCVGPFRAGLPSVSVETVGAGGGSQVTLDAGGALRVGPESAGADPGPACYGHGGPFTLTDAWLLLGRVPPALLGGAFALDRRAARRAALAVAGTAGLSVPALCRGAVAVAATTTARALRLASAARGKDPREAVLVAFGGAGPTLACDTAVQLGLPEVRVPSSPGTFAAEGALVAPLSADASALAPRGGTRVVERTLAQLARYVRRRLAAEGAVDVRLESEIDARYVGQAFEVTVPARDWEAAFHERHAARYGFADAARPVELVRLRVRGEGDEAGVRRRRADTLPGLGRVRTRRPRRDRSGIACTRRAGIEVGDRLRGPARIDEPSGTTFVIEGWHAVCLADRTLRLRRTR